MFLLSVLYRKIMKISEIVWIIGVYEVFIDMSKVLVTSGHSGDKPGEVVFKWKSEQ